MRATKTKELQCGECNERFVIKHLMKDYLYKEVIKGKMHYFCSSKCKSIFDNNLHKRRYSQYNE